MVLAKVVFLHDVKMTSHTRHLAPGRNPGFSQPSTLAKTVKVELWVQGQSWPESWRDDVITIREGEGRGTSLTGKETIRQFGEK